MAPTLNAHVASPFRAGERLVIRRLSSGSSAVDASISNGIRRQRMIAYRGDIVVVEDPEDAHRRYVRRVVAVQGDELVCEDEKAARQVLRLAPDQYWVMRDNDCDIEEEIAQLRKNAEERDHQAEWLHDTVQATETVERTAPLAAQANLLRILRRDSRDFGPVTGNHILGRVIYAIRNDVDHGRVRNSGLSMVRDDVILAVELQQQLGIC